MLQDEEHESKSDAEVSGDLGKQRGNLAELCSGDCLLFRCLLLTITNVASSLTCC